MKIKINKNEFYTIDFEEEVTTQQFIELIDRLNTIRRLLIKDPFIGVLSQQSNGKRTYIRTVKRGIKRKFICDRNEAVRVLRIHYHGSYKDKKAISKEYQQDWTNIAKSLPNVRKKWNIKPDEVGLIAFPRYGQGRYSLNNLRIPNFNISRERATLNKANHNEKEKD